jgi:hypothetical protein
VRWQVGSRYRLQEEVPVGQKPLQIDLLLVQQEAGELPAGARQILAGLVEYLGEFTLLEFKSPTDALRAGDFQTLLAYALLYRAQNDPLLDPNKLHLLVLAPQLTSPYREELRTLGVTPQPVENGIWRLQGGAVVHPTWVVETEQLAGVNHPLLSLFSPMVLHNGRATFEMLQQGGYLDLVIHFVEGVRQLLADRKELTMQRLQDEREMRQVLQAFLASLSPRERLEGLSLEERLEGLSPEELKELAELARRLSENGTPPPQS